MNIRTTDIIGKPIVPYEEELSDENAHQRCRVVCMRSSRSSANWFRNQHAFKCLDTGLVFHDTYSVIAYGHVMMLLGAFSLLMAAVYGLLHQALKNMSRILGIAHFAGTMLGIVAFVLPSAPLSTHYGPRRYYDYESSRLLGEFAAQRPILTTCMLIFFVSQLLLPLNILFALVRKAGTTRKDKNTAF